jgi:hypothetical protein
MRIHDWSRVPSGLFHDFHQSWSIRIKDALNAGRLPKGVAALVGERAGPFESDILSIETRKLRSPQNQSSNGGVATMAPPVTRIVRRSTNEIYASRANRIVVRHHLGRIIAVIEIIFLTNYLHVMVPLDPTYQATWDAGPEELRVAVETGVVPEPE